MKFDKIFYFALLKEGSYEHIKIAASKYLYNSDFISSLNLQECLESYIYFREYFKKESLELEILVNLIVDNFKIPDNLRNNQFRNVFNILEKMYKNYKNK
ncbi:MAG: hypothetical protein QW117_00395 [Candidatus Pacearchaeota archaeon]